MDGGGCVFVVSFKYTMKIKKVYGMEKTRKRVFDTPYYILRRITIYRTFRIALRSTRIT